MSLDLGSWTSFALAVGIAVLVGVGFWLGLELATTFLKRKYPRLVESSSRSRKHLLALVVVALLLIVVSSAWPYEQSKDILVHVLVIATIIAGAAFLTSVVTALIKQIKLRHPIQDDNDAETMRLHTQISVIQAFANAAIWLVAIGIAFFTIPGAHAVGTSFIASAGLASLVIGIAAQTVLGNVFAGLQLALNGSIRVGDLVVVEGQQGRVDTINLTTVVLTIFGGRTLVLPSSYFTTKPFENWTKYNRLHTGSVLLDVDWRVKPSQVQQQLDLIVKNSDLWDGATSDVVIDDATGGMVRIRAIVSAKDEDDLALLRNQVRQGLVEWIADSSPNAIPVQRVFTETVDN